MNAAEHVRAVAEDVGDVRPTRVDGDVDRAPRRRIGHPAHHHHAEDVAGRVVARGERGDVEIEDQLAVARQERLVGAVRIEQRERVLEPAAGARATRRLVEVLDPRAEPAAVAELALDRRRRGGAC